MSRPVLLIEDDDELTEVMQVVLRSQGFVVASAGDGLEALDLLAKGLRPSVILLDLMLPNLDGYAFRERAKALADVPVIVVSALDDLAARAQGLNLAAWFRKPVDLDVLIATVTRLAH